MSAHCTHCPSGQCEEGAQLLGVVQADGTIGYLGQPIPIDADFVATARTGRSPERRFRFTSKCVEGACQQWTGTRCGVIDKMIEALQPVDEATLPRCGIRSYCRWFHQNGVAACRTCRLVITDCTDK